MKHIALTTTLLSLSFAAAAQTAAPLPTANAPAATAPAAPTEPVAVLEQVAPQAAVTDRTCVSDTGSRVVRADRSGRRCVNAPGRTYTREDINSTGAVDLGEALRRLDPSIR